MELQKCPHGHDARVAAVESKSGQWTAYAYCDRRDCHWLSAPYYADAEEAAKEKAARVIVKVIDCQAEPRIAAAYHIQTTPTTLIARDGMVVYQASGALDQATLARRIREAK